MITEEFSFPVITSNNAVNLALLPPLWRISSINIHSDSDDAEVEQENGRKRRIFTSFSGEITKMDASQKEDEKEEVEAQEKMDVLWEDFNEELQITILDSSDSDFSQLETCRDHKNNKYYNNSNSSREELETLEECRNVRDLKLVGAAKRNKLELVVKMMKKLFLLQNTAATKKRGPK